MSEAEKPERNRAKGKLYLWLGTVVMLLGTGSIFMLKSGVMLGGLRPAESTVLIIVAAGFLVAAVGIRIVFRGKGLMALDGDVIIDQSERPMFLYLRSFGLDQEDGENRMPVYPGLSIPINPWESGLAYAFSKIGDLVAIGRPGEEFATTGAARVYVTDDQWQEKVLELVEKSALIVWTYGATEGLKWEIKRLVELVPPEKLVIALPLWKLTPEERQVAWTQAREAISDIFPSPLPDDIGESLFISFGANWESKIVTARPTHLMIRAAMLFARNHVVEGVYGLLASSGYDLPKPGYGVFALSAMAILTWLTLLSVILVMLYYWLFVAFV